MSFVVKITNPYTCYIDGWMGIKEKIGLLMF